jgi:phospholipase D-like protein
VLLFEEGLIPLLLLGLWIYCIFDVIAGDDVLIRNLPKGIWLMIVIFLPDIGSLAWLLLGRPLYAGWRPGDTTRRAPRRVLGPEDRDDFPTGRVAPPPPPRRIEPPRPGPPPLGSRADELAAWEEQLRRREEELRRREQGEGPAAP